MLRGKGVMELRCFRVTVFEGLGVLGLGCKGKGETIGVWSDVQVL